jgi:1-aminocyclopropane-1-carboxylate deaminase
MKSLDKNLPNFQNSILSKIETSDTQERNINLYLKRDDLIHPEISGNKWRKLHLNIDFALKNGYSKILTFGGPWSNHLHATFAASQLYDFDLIAVVRGEKPQYTSDVLTQMEENRTEIYYITRKEYDEIKYQAVVPKFILDKSVFVIPEGGCNEWGRKGSESIVDELQSINYDLVCIPAGSGTTASGILRKLSSEKMLKVFAPFKKEDALFSRISESGSNFDFITEFHFGGFAKHNQELIDFVEKFKQEHQIQLDYIYNGKMMYGIFEKIKRGDFLPNSTIVAVHTGGVQGNRGINT